jgi:hypothetical protein
VVQAAKAATIPALYFTNLISARPLMGPAGAGSLAQVVNAAIANKARFEQPEGGRRGVGLSELAELVGDEGMINHECAHGARVTVRSRSCTSW